jgi:hypothetical protein
MLRDISEQLKKVVTDYQLLVNKVTWVSTTVRTGTGELLNKRGLIAWLDS